MKKIRVSKKGASTIGVLVPSYQRPDSLARCLASLGNQTLPAAEILVVVRAGDQATLDVISSPIPQQLPIRVIKVSKPGAVAARNAGLNACRTDILAFTDDDTAPHPDWLHQVLKTFQEDPTLGGLGGRDRCFGDGKFNDEAEAEVGKIRWYGKVIGNHHLGFGSIREVDVLKGANMSFRAEAFSDIRFDLRLKGSGAQPGEDLCFTVAVKKLGWKIAYDPAVLVDHYPAERNDIRYYAGVGPIGDRTKFYEFAYNQVVMLWDALSPIRRLAYFGWASLIGTGIFPGLVQAIRFTPRLRWQSWERFFIAQAARQRAFWQLTRSKSRATGP